MRFVFLTELVTTLYMFFITYCTAVYSACVTFPFFR